MKTLKFKPELVSLILSGEKTVTWRIFDDKDIQEGDVLTFLHSETLEPFGEGRVIVVREKELGDVTEEDFDGHERYSSKQEMIETYQSYYGDRVSEETPVKIISFTFSKI